MKADRIKSIARRCALCIRDLLFPPRCVGCEELLAPFDASAPIFCPMCRTSWEAGRGEWLRNGHRDPAHVNLVAYHTGRADGVPERLVYYLKHHDEARVFSAVAAFLAPNVMQACDELRSMFPSHKAPAVLVSYPPRTRRALRKDGFDQAERISRALARKCSYRHAKLIARTHARVSEQKRLVRQDDRRENAARAYRLTRKAEKMLRGKIVVLVDDLVTTGSTLHVCADLLHKAGAVAVVYASVAHTASSKTNKSTT